MSIILSFMQNPTEFNSWASNVQPLCSFLAKSCKTVRFPNYADDTQIYLFLSAKDYSPVSLILSVYKGKKQLDETKLSSN